MPSQQVSLQSNVKGYYTGTKASIEALTGVPDGSIAFGWTTDPSDGEFGIYNGTSWTWGTGAAFDLAAAIAAAATATPANADKFVFRQNTSGVVKTVTYLELITFFADYYAFNEVFATGDHDHGSHVQRVLAIIDPTVDDDTSLGYEPPTLWINTVSNVPWILVDNADGAAIWLSLNTYTQDEVDDMLDALNAVFAPISKGVTNGDTHDHNGGDGAQINHTTLSNIGTRTHAQIDTFIGTTHPAHTHQVPDVLIMFGNLVSVPASTTWHMNVGKTGADGTTHNLPFPVDCVIENIYLRTANGQPASGSLTATLVTGGSTVTALVATATAGGGAASYTGSGSIAVSAGTLIRVQVQNNATAGSAQISYVSLKLRYTSSIVD